MDEKQQLNPSALSTNDVVKETDPKKSLTARPDITTGPVMAEPSLQESEHDSVQSIEGQVMYENMMRSQYNKVFSVD